MQAKGLTVWFADNIGDPSILSKVSICELIKPQHFSLSIVYKATTLFVMYSLNL